MSKIVPITAPTLAETDELLAELAAMPRVAEVAKLVDLVLDYRLLAVRRGAAHV